MDVIESIKKDKAYLKSKLIVKNWEKQFKHEHNRTPSKFDIKEAPANIKYAYKKYFQLKSAALENSLSICDFDDELILPLEPQKLENPSETADSEDPLIPSLPSVQELQRILNPKTEDVSKSPFTENLSKKLFLNRKFSIRNPRKSISNKSIVDESIIKEVVNENKTEVLKNTQDSQNCVNKATELRNTVSIENSTNTTSREFESPLSNPSLMSSENSTNLLRKISVRQIDKGWCDRVTSLSETEPVLISHPIVDNKIEKFGLANLSMSNIVDKTYDYVENSESDDDIAISKLKPALKKQKLDPSTKAIVDNKQQDDDIDIDNGEVENIKQKKNQKNAMKRSKRDRITNKPEEGKELPPDINEYVAFGLNEKVNPRHANVSDILKTITSKSEKSPPKISNGIDKLELKVQNGTLNDNFVKINIEKKVFVRGKKSINYSKYKKQLWKDKKALHAGMEFPEAGKVTCFKCNQTGHMARYCTAHRGSSLLPLEDCDESNMPTLEDMQKIVSSQENQKTEQIEEQLSNFVYEASQVPEHFLQLLAETPENSDKVKPIYTEYNENLNEIYEVLKMFGHSGFRSGQECAIKRILCGLSTLLILSTGGGKSLCYQLPAYIYSKYYKCITLVISPLVSLMEDQVLNMPEFLKAGCLHTNQSPTQRKKIMELIKKGEINILLISPEALIAGDTSSGFAGLFKSLPQIAFACIDEAHCVSQWSHNFRPSYLMICRVLREKLNVKCILGLTATASQATIKSVINHINVPDGVKGVLTNPALPDNLFLSISFEKDKDRALVSLLASEGINSFSSIIVYCIRRNECERIAAVIRSCLFQPGKINMEKENKKRKRMSYIAEAYHAGMSAAQRKKIQKHFMDGTLKIIVATVAFGMGINKSDIRCIIHYNMPPSFESYVQEVGRAGRDGKPAFCHVFMNNKNDDKDELLKHIYANSIDRPVIRRLLQKIFIPCKCISPEKTDNSKITNASRCQGHEVGIPIDETVEELDLPSENIATLLCYVELHHKHYIKVLHNAYTKCKISSYGGPIKILEAAKTCPPLAMAYLIESKKAASVTKLNVLEFNVIEVAAAIGWESGMTKYQLKNLEWIVKDGVSKRSHLKVEFNTLGFRLKSPGDLSATELDELLDDLHQSVHVQEKNMLYQLEEIHQAFNKLCNKSCDQITFSEENLAPKSNELKLIINDYFTRENNMPENKQFQERPLDTERITSDVRALIATYKDCKFTGRSIARIFQGITSPNYPALVWGRCKFWRSHLHEDFNGIIRIATQQIINMKI
ncbi:ATP-dependent DNA helicase Q4 [Danaus plexippus]|uniref:ATP-dependent DNA helicase Q4 n=1 Tax=Danaus plexippus TaxID=13037 RepID=UPI002AB1796A|nr:ATP-dependent DNA helicase Q4 [Danaus plexippus]